MSDFYSFDELDKTNAKYRIVVGERSNGKTYGFKKKCIENWLHNGKQFGLIRRFEDDVRPSRIQTYFSDMDDYLNEEFSKAYPQYKMVFMKAQQGKFTLYGYDDDDIKYEIGIIGYYFSLNTSTRSKGSQFPNITLIGFDEFMTNERELDNEFSRFLNIVSTIVRRRTDVTIYMMGNTVNRRSQLLNGMNINVTKLKQGEISMFYTYHEDGSIANTIAVEYCRHYEISKESEAYYRFDNPKEAMIINGQWEVDDYPKFDIDEFYDKKILIGFIFEDSSVRLYGYVTNDNELLISDKRLYNICDYITLTTNRSFFNRKTFNWKCGIPKIENIENKIINFKLNGLIKYNNNLTGDDFEHFLNECNKIK